MCFGRKTTRPRTHSYMGQEDQCVGGERHLMLAGRRKAGQLKPWPKRTLITAELMQYLMSLSEGCYD